jgi:hypothetical protein
MKNCDCLCTKHDKEHVTKIVVTEKMVRSPYSIRDDFGRMVMLSSGIGYLMNKDIGKTLYIKNGVVTMTIDKDNNRKVIINGN